MNTRCSSHAQIRVTTFGGVFSRLQNHIHMVNCRKKTANMFGGWGRGSLFVTLGFGVGLGQRLREMNG
eukprot:2510699-Amphidinium_carterae.1